MLPKIFFTNKVVKKCFTLTHVDIIQAHTLKGYGTNCAAIEKYLGCTFLKANMLRLLLHLIAWVEFPFLTLLIDTFGLGFYNRLGTYCDLY